MLMADAVLLVVVVGAVVFGAFWLVARPRDHRLPAAASGRWRVAHYDVKGQTRIVVQKVPDSGASVLDEHLVATFPSDDPEYDEKFLAAMSTARQRQALFQSEQDG